MSKSKKSILSVLFGFKCPRCREGNLFVQPFSIKSAFGMEERCARCDLNYTPEPGFYFGAMFISYIITAWVFVTIAGATMYFLDFSVDQAILSVIIFAAVSFIFFFRFGRAIWLAMNVKYKPNSTIDEKVEQHIK